jgi:photosystem II stability/assembly factor-like uncharacterized protein
MAKPTADQIVTQQHKRFYVQFGGARPGNTVRYGGVDGQYMIISGVTKPGSTTDPIRVPDPHKIGGYRRVARSNTPADDPSATITFLEQHGVMPLAFADSGCPVNAYEVTGLCKDLSDFIGGWEDYVMIYANGEKNDLDGGDRGAWDGDDQIEDAVDYTFSDIYPVGSISFAEYASNEISREVIDAVYGPATSCGNCGPANDGTRRLYAVAKSSGTGSPGLPGELIYTLDGGASWTEAAIAGLGATEDPKAIDIVGDKLVVLTSTAYYLATLNQNTGAPGVFTKVTTGFNALAPFNDMFVLSSREIFFAAQSGYIYKSTDILGGVSTISAGAATAQNLLRIHGDELSGALYAVGANSVTLKSIDRGRSWATTAGTLPTTTASVQAIAVLDHLRAWAGTSSGRVFFTLDGGENWTEKVVSSDANIRDILFSTDDVGYIAYDSATPTAYLLTTWNGGESWAVNGSGPRLASLPTMDRVNRIAAPITAESMTAANYVALAALHGNGTDGLLALGAAVAK